ncbi:MAG: hypothetical protein HY810_08380 [Candidatus Omnitrophica bacterium]|nr:hypothetical protein [Candidatus Omnitrophota bacterium]
MILPKIHKRFLSRAVVFLLIQCFLASVLMLDIQAAEINYGQTLLTSRDSATLAPQLNVLESKLQDAFYVQGRLSGRIKDIILENQSEIANVLILAAAAGIFAAFNYMNVQDASVSSEFINSGLILSSQIGAGFNNRNYKSGRRTPDNRFRRTKISNARLAVKLVVSIAYFLVKSLFFVEKVVWATAGFIAKKLYSVFSGRKINFSGKEPVNIKAFFKNKGFFAAVIAITLGINIGFIKMIDSVLSTRQPAGISAPEKNNTAAAPKVTGEKEGSSKVIEPQREKLEKSRSGKKNSNSAVKRKSKLTPEDAYDNAAVFLSDPQVQNTYKEIFQVLKPTGFPVELLIAIDLAETDLDDKKVSRAGARGPMQVVPKEAERINLWLKKNKNNEIAKVMMRLLKAGQIDVLKLGKGLSGRRAGAAIAYYHYMRFIIPFFDKYKLVYMEEKGSWGFFERAESDEKYSYTSSVLFITFNGGPQKFKYLMKKYGPLPRISGAENVKKMKFYDPRQKIGFLDKTFESDIYFSRCWVYFNAVIKVLDTYPDIFAKVNDFKKDHVSKADNSRAALIIGGTIFIPPFRRKKIPIFDDPLSQAI